MKNPIEDDPDIHMIKQPFLTEGGFVNEACMNELNSFIKNMPEIYDRFSDNPEWTKKIWTADTDILGYLAHSAICCYGDVPPNLEDIVKYVRACLRNDPFKKVCDKRDKFRLAEMSLCDINRILWDYLGDLQMFKDWNDGKIMGPRWIGLSACLRNVCICIRDERRNHEAFGVKVDEKTD